VTLMRAVESLLSRIVDYAGLFPPAKLDMATTIWNYASYLDSNESWMLGRLIVPATRLKEYEIAAAEMSREKRNLPWALSAVLSDAKSSALPAELQSIEAFNMRNDEGGESAGLVEVLEMKADSAAAINGALEFISRDFLVFFELPIDRDPGDLIEALAAAGAGAKVRTGGLTRDAVPSPEHLARFIAVCAAADVPFKATAGLHHPLRHHSESLGTEEFGFLNVFIGACLAHSHELSESELVELLCETSLSAVTVEDDVIAWRGYPIASANIEDVREEFAISFGSCSFDEPVEHLRALRLLDEPTATERSSG
jgi:hypothetical protein